MVTVLVNGLPGAGKTTLARALARELTLPLFSKDVVKETLADTLEPPADADPGARLRWSEALGGAAAETLWTLLTWAPDGAVFETPLLPHQRHFAVAGLARAGVADLHEVWCAVPPELARQRTVERAPTRHPVHLDGARTDDDARWARWSREAAPLALGPVHRVDTTGPVDVPGLARRIRA